MAISKVIKREIEVAFSKRAQPVWFRVLKYVLLWCLLYFLWGSKWLWIILAILLALSFSLHIWYRHKTHGWTKNYGGWDYEKNKPHKIE